MDRWSWRELFHHENIQLGLFFSQLKEMTEVAKVTVFSKLWVFLW